MLKIKDNVDLKELEKYGFRETTDSYNNECNDLEYFIDKKDNSICMCSTYGECDLLDNTLYNLIKDGLVEKVE